VKTVSHITYTVLAGT